MPDRDACPLCFAATRLYFVGERCDYRVCARCALVHVPRRWHLPAHEERAYYDLHQNRVDDPRYRRFLSRLADPVLERLRLPAEGLDFGCGPGPALAAMLEERGVAIRLYYRYFHADPAAFERVYDLVTLSEVAEHLAAPAMELDRLWALLRPGGWCGIMTRRLPAPERFADWHYRRDPTHVAFYAAATFEFLAARWGAGLVLLGDDVALLHRVGEPAGGVSLPGEAGAQRAGAARNPSGV